MLVYFVGGVTYMEIAALRFLSAQKECESIPDLLVCQRYLILPRPKALHLPALVRNETAI